MRLTFSIKDRDDDGRHSMQALSKLSKLQMLVALRREETIFQGLLRQCLHSTYTTFEPRREKTGLRGFRPGPTQTGLYKLRKELEA